MSEIEVNGKKYIRKQEPENKSKSSKSMMKTMAYVALASYAMAGYSRKRPAVDIVKEYELIQQKKSKLPRSDREWVERVFNQQYIEIKEEKCQ